MTASTTEYTELAHALKSLLAAFLVFVISPSLFAGIAHVLHEDTYGDCKVTISHDAVDGHSGVIVIRSLTNENSLCPIPKE